VTGKIYYLSILIVIASSVPVFNKNKKIMKNNQIKNKQKYQTIKQVIF